MARVRRVGLISDTHGHLDERVHDAFAGVDSIVHAGDVCSDQILYELQAIATPVTAVAGNCDLMGGGWALDHVAIVEEGGVRILVVHDIKSLTSVPGDVDVVVHGHTHEPRVGSREHAVTVNPGSASQRRRMPSRSVAILEIDEECVVRPRIIMLDAVAPPR